MNIKPHNSQPVTPLDITKLFYVSDFDELFEKNPVNQLASLLGLQHYEWLSYDYLQSEIKDNPTELANKGIRIVNGILGF